MRRARTRAPRPAVVGTAAALAVFGALAGVAPGVAAAPAAAPGDSCAWLGYLPWYEPSCDDALWEVMTELPRLVAADEPDSALGLVGLVSDVCPGPAGEPEVAAQLLTAIWAGAFADSLLGDDFVAHLEEVRGLDGAWCAGEFGDAPDWQDRQEEFCAFLRDLAVDLYELVPPGGTESLLCRFYGGDRDGALDLLATGRLPGTRLQQLYDRSLAPPAATWRGDLALLGDTWRPRGGLSRLGPHPGLGLRAGAGRGRWRVLVEAVHRFREADQPWTVRRAGVSLTTRRHVSWHLELLGGARVLRRGPADLDLLLGAGWAGLQFVPGSDQDAGRWLGSFAGSAGAEVRLAPVRPGWRPYLGLQARWEQTWFDTGGGSDLGGGALVLRVLLGVTAPVPGRKE